MVAPSEALKPIAIVKGSLGELGPKGFVEEVGSGVIRGEEETHVVFPAGLGIWKEETVLFSSDSGTATFTKDALLMRRADALQVSQETEESTNNLFILNSGKEMHALSSVKEKKNSQA